MFVQVYCSECRLKMSRVVSEAVHRQPLMSQHSISPLSSARLSALTTKAASGAASPSPQISTKEDQVSLSSHFRNGDCHIYNRFDMDRLRVFLSWPRVHQANLRAVQSSLLLEAASSDSCTASSPAPRTISCSSTRQQWESE